MHLLQRAVYQKNVPLVFSLVLMLLTCGLNAVVDYGVIHPEELTVDELIQQVGRGSTSNKIRAIDELGERKAQEAVPALVPFAVDSETLEVVRNKAISALGKIGGSESYAALIGIALSKEEEIPLRQQAILRIGQNKDEAAVPFLVSVIKPQMEPILRITALKALGHIPSKQTTDALFLVIKNTKINEELFIALESLLQVDQPLGVKMLIRLLNTTETRKHVKFALQHLVWQDAQEAGPSITLALKETYGGEEILFTLKAIAELQLSEATDAILPLLQDPSFGIQHTAAQTLAALAAPQAAPVLVERFLEIANEPLPVENDTMIAQQLRLREGYLRAISQTFSPAGVEAFKKAALPLTIQASSIKIKSLQKRAQNLQRIALLGLAASYDPSAPAFVLEHQLHRDASLQVRAAAVKVLAMGKDDASSDAMIEALQDSSPKVRIAAAQALRESRRERVISPLIGVLNDDHPGVVIEALYSLSRFPQTAAKDAIRQTADSAKDPIVKKLATDLTSAGLASSL